MYCFSLQLYSKLVGSAYFMVFIWILFLPIELTKLLNLKLALQSKLNMFVTIMCQQNPRQKRERYIHKGPNGVRDYKAHVVTDYEYIGETVKNKSTTTSLKFLSREPEGVNYPPRRRQYVGEVGWKVDDGFMNQVNEKVLRSGNQIQLKVFRKALEENSTHKFQNNCAPAYNNRGVSGYPPGMALKESMGRGPQDNPLSSPDPSGSESSDKS